MWKTLDIVTNKVMAEAFGLVWFNGISTIIDYLMPIFFYTYVLNLWFLNTFVDHIF